MSRRKSKTNPRASISDDVAKDPTDEQRRALLHGPYRPPRVRIGQTMTCMLRGRAKVCGWTDGRIPWPIIPVGHGGKGAHAMTPDLARAIRLESGLAIMYWWGFCMTHVADLRRTLGVGQYNEGTRRLWSLWKQPKLPDRCQPISKAVLRRKRLATGMNVAQVARAIGWSSRTSYVNLELGLRVRVGPRRLARLAKVLGCRSEELLTVRRKR